MAYCSKCGKPIKEGAAFCSSCGAPIENETVTGRNQVYAGAVQKCPNCGQALGTFQSYCPACGYELRVSDQSDSIKRFSQELSLLEGGSMIQGEGSSNSGGDAAFSTPEALIKNFVVPNTKADIFEFMILAQANLSVCRGSSKADRDKIDAWAVKAEQVYQKGKIALPSEDLGQLDDLYKSVCSELEKKRGESTTQRKRRQGRGIIGVLAGLFGGIAGTIDSIISGNASLFQLLAVALLCISIPIACDKGRSLLGVILGLIAAVVCFVCGNILEGSDGNGSMFFLLCLICSIMVIFNFIRYLLFNSKES